TVPVQSPPVNACRINTFAGLLAGLTWPGPQLCNRLALRSCTVYPHALHMWAGCATHAGRGGFLRRFTVSTRLNQGLMWAAIVGAMAVTPVLTLAQRDGGAAPAAQGAPAGGGARGGARGAANQPPAGP